MFKELLKANIICTIACKECGHGNIIDYTHTTVHLEHVQANQADTTVSNKVRDLLRQREKMAMCTVCQRETRLENTFNYQFSKYLFLKVARNTWNTKKNKMERTEQRINPRSPLISSPSTKKQDSIQSDRRNHPQRGC